MTVMGYKATSETIYSLLTQSTALMKKVKGVYDEPPQDITGPYIVIGQLQALPGRLLNDTERKWFVDIYIWSSYNGRKEVVEIADIIEGLLPRDMWMDEFVVRSDPTSGWWEGVMTIKGYMR